MSTLKKYLNSLAIKFSIAKELMIYLWRNKLWWAIPIILIILLLMMILFFGQSSGLAPFIYPIF